MKRPQQVSFFIVPAVMVVISCSLYLIRCRHIWNGGDDIGRHAVDDLDHDIDLQLWVSDRAYLLSAYPVREEDRDV